jgi:hypothetical protein
MRSKSNRCGEVMETLEERGRGSSWKAAGFEKRIIHDRGVLVLFEKLGNGITI